MTERELELKALDFEVGGFRNNYRNVIIYFDNDDLGIIKKQVFINGTPETKFLLRELNTKTITVDTLNRHHFVTLVLEVGGQNRIVAMANDEGDFQVIRDEYFDYGETSDFNGNIKYFEKTYGVSEEELTSKINEAVIEKMKADITREATLRLIEGSYDRKG